MKPTLLVLELLGLQNQDQMKIRARCFNSAVCRHKDSCGSMNDGCMWEEFNQTNQVLLELIKQLPGWMVYSITCI